MPLERFNSKDSPKIVNGYLRQKGIKYSEIIEIQFYVNQIEKELKAKGVNDNVISKTKQEFVKIAKQMLKKQRLEQPVTQSLYELANQYLNDVIIAQRTTSYSKLPE